MIIEISHSSFHYTTHPLVSYDMDLERYWGKWTRRPEWVVRHGGVGGIAVWGGVHVVCIEVSGFETVNGDSVFMTIDIDGEVLIRLFDDWGQRHAG